MKISRDTAVLVTLAVAALVAFAVMLYVHLSSFLAVIL